MLILQKEAKDIIRRTGCILKGEFFFALKKKGNVATEYVNFDPFFTHPKEVEYLGIRLAKKFREDYSVIAAPAVGAIPLLFAVAQAHDPEIRTVWADKQKDGSFAFERMGFANAVRGKQVLVVEDVGSTGGSAKSVCDLVKKHGGTVVGVGFIWNRGGVTAEAIDVPCVRSLINERIETWKAEDHPEWGVWPLVEDIGHPEHFPDYPGQRIKLLE
jgi:orotate phosphoribosyltransferase